jgi:bifunctional aspartokinase / homoserine dehydrogenase 1
MKVLKFGGTSVGSIDSIKQVIDILKSEKNPAKTVVVVSAFSGVTDQLIEVSQLAEIGSEIYLDMLKGIETRHILAVKELINPKNQSSLVANFKVMFNELEDVLHGVFLLKELSAKSLDYVASFGERLSSLIITDAFIGAGIETSLVDARNQIRTDRTFNNARVNVAVTEANIQAYYKKNKTLTVVPGFIASTDRGEVTTLGRGGSDYTAAIYAAALNAKVLEIWTDVDGVLTANPKVVRRAIPIPQLSYDEAMELSYFGAKVIYPPTIQPALDRGIPIVIKNTFNASAPGTRITAEAPMGEAPVKGITSISNISLLTISGSGMVGISGTSMRFFGALGRNKISVILISQASSEHSITIAVTDKESEKAKLAIEEEFEYELQSGKIDPIAMEQKQSIVAIVGQNMRNTPGIAGKLFSVLGRNGINIRAIAQGTSELNISFVIDKQDESKALNVIHESFFLSNTKVAHIYLVGVGLVGKTLVKQIQQQQAYLKDKLGLELRLAAVSNSKKMAFDAEGIAWEDIAKVLEKSKQKADIDKFAKEVVNLNLRNGILVDCTADDVVGTSYKAFLEHSIAVVTPNKVAASGPYALYAELNRVAQKRGARWLYETNVGAGLPVLSTLSDLVKSGDQIHRIEAVLSGTMNFIFNTVSAKMPFSNTVKEAKVQGYTEPDPRIDLSGKDVARKILILAREAGYMLEFDEVEIVNFLPGKVFKTKDIEGLWTALEAYDAEFDVLRTRIEKEKKKLRLVASFDGKAAKVELREFTQDHPFYNLEGSDSIVLFYTDRYHKNPLVVKGAGAGAEVTAAGVFADVIRLRN